MRFIANVLWHIPYLGFIDALICFLLGGLLVLTVVGAPVGLGLIQLGKLYLAPFGHNMVHKDNIPGQTNKDGFVWKLFSLIVRIIYFPFGLVLTALIITQMIGCVLTVVGFPVAMVLFKSLGTIWNPVNKVCL